MKARSVLIILIAILFIFPATSVFAHTPSIVSLVIDGSVSMERKDFEKANVAFMKFADTLYERSTWYPYPHPDWLSLNYFGGDNDYDGTRFVNCSDAHEILRIEQHAYQQKHPRYGKTAIYTAIGRAIRKMEAHEKSLRKPDVFHVKTIILITDGKDSSSDDELKEEVKNAPNYSIQLFLIGGPGSDIKQFEEVADWVVPLDSFDELELTLLLMFPSI